MRRVPVPGCARDGRRSAHHAPRLAGGGGTQSAARRRSQGRRLEPNGRELDPRAKGCPDPPSGPPRPHAKRVCSWAQFPPPTSGHLTVGSAGQFRWPVPGHRRRRPGHRDHPHRRRQPPGPRWSVWSAPAEKRDEKAAAHESRLGRQSLWPAMRSRPSDAPAVAAPTASPAPPRARYALLRNTPPIRTCDLGGHRGAVRGSGSPLGWPPSAVRRRPCSPVEPHFGVRAPQPVRPWRRTGRYR